MMVSCPAAAGWLERTGFSLVLSSITGILLHIRSHSVKNLSSSNRSSMSRWLCTGSMYSTVDGGELQVSLKGWWWRDGMSWLMDGPMAPWLATTSCLVAVATSSSGIHRVLRGGAPTRDDVFLFMEPRDTSVMLWIWAPPPNHKARFGEEFKFNKSRTGHGDLCFTFLSISITIALFAVWCAQYNITHLIY